MSRDKQIEEMAKDLKNHTCMSQFQAEIASRMLYIKGYRKASDMVRDIFEEVEKLIYRLLNDIHYIAGDLVWDINELKKKYESEGADDETNT